jgi:aminoglycoside phosphotransferase (APT) family kinase protein
MSVESAIGSPAPAGVDANAVSGWLIDTGLAGPFSFQTIAGGKSNLTYRVTAANGARYVLRRPPLGHVLATAHDVAREHRIISALSGSAVPVAETVGVCTDDSRNGAPFYVMNFVDGVVLDSPAMGATIGIEARMRASHDLIDTLVALHSIDPDSVGLGDLAKREGFLDRQLRRWKMQWDQSKTREQPLMDEVHRRLLAAQPIQRAAGIVHGDYRLGNCLVDALTGELKAVLDWELCTLGDVLADVGYLLVYWSDPQPGAVRMAENDPSGQEGFPSRAEMVTRYAAATGRDVVEISYYEAFSCWRLASIAEGVLSRYMAGVMGDATDFDIAGGAARVDALAQRSMNLLDAISG